MFIGSWVLTDKDQIMGSKAGGVINSLSEEIGV